jgi:fused signal recognition particle receptor
LFETLKKAISSISQTVSSRELSDKEIDEVLQNFQRQLLQNDVAFDVASDICNSLKTELKQLRVKRVEDSEQFVKQKIMFKLRELLFTTESKNFYDVIDSRVKQSGLCVLVFFGINGSGKTTTIAKLAYSLRQRGFKPVLAAADTFRAGAIEQLRLHAERLSVPFFGSKYGSDPASVGFSAIQESKAKKYNVVLIDTAGRMQNDANLVDQMRKVVRVAKPDLKIFVGDSLVGNDAINQLKEFNEKVGIDGVILTKMDADSRGGIILSIASLIKRPIFFVGTGQGYSDLEPFTPDFLLKKLF